MARLTPEQERQLEEYLQTLPESERDIKKKEILDQLQQSAQCPFCLMSEGKIETIKIYEDENFLAVLEINPANEGHTILTSKKHIKTFSQLNQEEVESCARILKKLISSVVKSFGSVNTLISEGPDSGQKFEHLVINIIPRKKGDSVSIVWQPSQSKLENLEKVKNKIVENFPEPEETKEFPSIDMDEIEEEFRELKKRLP